MAPDDDLRAEGQRFGRYLLGDELAPLLVDRYVAAMRSLELSIDRRDRDLLDLVKHHPRLLGLVDGGLALRRPQSAIRTKLLVMSAILEATPEHMAAFDPVRRRRTYLLYASYVAVRGGFKGLAGAILITFT